jgi:hypothetical protein
MRLKRSLLAACVASGLLAAPASATWSIVVYNKLTGEVCVASCTCVPNLDLELVLAVVKVGQGGGCVQFQGDLTTLKRQIIWDGFEAGIEPERILQIIADHTSGHHGTQIGIASAGGRPVTFTGDDVWDPNHGVWGQNTELAWAIQGNVITGPPVVLEAQRALLAAPGDLGQRVMAALEASRAMGGDGRCSCSDSNPGGCGSPPPNFTKSAHVGFIILARMGDQDGVCASGQGCTNGEYYLHRKVVNGVQGPDPVLRLQEKYDLWRAALAGVPDQLRSEVVRGAQELPADGLARTTVTVRLCDVDGTPLASGGQTLTIMPQHPGAPATFGPLTDHGDGTHSFDVTASTTPGRAAWHVWVNDGARDVLLWPPLAVEVVPVPELHSSWYEVSAASGASVTFTVSRGAADAGRPYQLLGTTTGTEPGTPFGGVTLPLNGSRFLDLTLAGVGGTVFESFQGVLDASGRAEATFHVSPALAAPLLGRTFDFCALLGGSGAQYEVTGTDGFQIRP